MTISQPQPISIAERLGVVLKIVDQDISTGKVVPLGELLVLLSHWPLPTEGHSTGYVAAVQEYHHLFKGMTADEFRLLYEAAIVALEWYRGPLEWSEPCSRIPGERGFVAHEVVPAAHHATNNPNTDEMDDLWRNRAKTNYGFHPDKLCHAASWGPRTLWRRAAR